MLKKLSLFFGDKTVTTLFFIWRHRYIPSFKKPKTFSEKISSIKFFNNNHLRSMITDRIKVRDHVLKVSPNCNLIKVLWVGEYLDKATWDNLPEKFVAKANHGSRMVEICDKKNITRDYINDKFNEWIKNDYHKIGREWFYKDLDKKVLIEEMLDFSGTTPPDYKFFVTNGKVILVHVDSDRFNEPSRNVYDENFLPLDIAFTYPVGKPIEKPLLFEEAKCIAEKLGHDFDFIRVDLYIFEDKIYFGELTNIPGNGFAKIYPKKSDYDLGALLPEDIAR